MNTTTKPVQQEQSAHWYDQYGRPCHTQPNGKPTTLYHARKYGYAPSVTTVLGILDKPGLRIWQRNQDILAATTLPRIVGESLDGYVRRVLEDSATHAKEAAEEGSRIHAAIEAYYKGDDVLDKDYLMARHVAETLFADYDLHPDDCVPEHTFHSSMGYGGCVDLHCHSPRTVADFKTSEFSVDDMGKPSKRLHWPDHACQLAAYRHGLGMSEAVCINVFISRTTGDIYCHEWAEDEIHEEWLNFTDALSIWKRRKNYDPST